MSSLIISSPSLLPIPFDQGKYTGSIQCNIYKNDSLKNKACLIEVEGQRIALKTFTSPFTEEFKNKFSSMPKEKLASFFRDEFKPLCKIFKNPENVKNYASGIVNTDNQINERLNRDSRRPLAGDVFTGFAIIDKQTNEVIGRAGVGMGDTAGESQFGLILRKDYHGKKLGKETAILMAALALVYFENKFMVGDDKLKAPVTRFTATALNTNISRNLLKLGAKPIKTLPSGWFQGFCHFIGLDRLLEYVGYPLNMRKIYEIKGKDLRPTLSKYMDIEKLKTTQSIMAAPSSPKTLGETLL